MQTDCFAFSSIQPGILEAMKIIHNLEFDLDLFIYITFKLSWDFDIDYILHIKYVREISRDLMINPFLNQGNKKTQKRYVTLP